MPSYSIVQSIHRALQLLRELNQHASSSVDMLHRTAGLPKPTVVRILETLVAEGYVEHDARPGWYCVTSEVHALSCGFHSEPAVVEAGRSLALAITQRVKWSVAIATLDHTDMVIRYSTIPFSPVAVYHTSINMRLPLATRAFGLAYLAFCSETERSLLLKLIASKELLAYQFEANDIRTVLRCIQADGFAERHGAPDAGADSERKSSSTIAVPIIAGDRVHATLGITYFTSAISRALAVAEYVPLLQQTAREIASRLADETGNGLQTKRVKDLGPSAHASSRIASRRPRSLLVQ
jgi:IclR family mhp operon transcriptional activator